MMKRFPGLRYFCALAFAVFALDQIRPFYAGVGSATWLDAPFLAAQATAIVAALLFGYSVARYGAE